MIKILKSVLFLPIILIIFIFASNNCARAITIQNNYLLVSIDDETGRLFLSTTKGKPDVNGDEKKNLLFYDRPPSSYTLIYIDDDIVTYGDDIGNFTPPIADINSIKLKWKYRNISVIQEVKFIKRKNSGIPDGVLIKYTVINKDNFTHKIGFRILFDTYLGENSIYHFELSNGEKLKGAKSFDKNNMPEYWISKDKKGIICLRGVLKGDYVITPDRVVFANYKALRENLKNYYIRNSRNFDYPPYSRNDSAVSLYYYPKKINPGDKRVVYTVLGLCGNESYESEKPIIEVASTEEKKIGKEEQSKSKSVIYHVKDYNAFKVEMENIYKLKNDIKTIDVLLKEIDDILEKRNSGEKIDMKKIKNIKEKLGVN